MKKESSLSLTQLKSVSLLSLLLTFFCTQPSSILICFDSNILPNQSSALFFIYPSKWNSYIF